MVILSLFDLTGNMVKPWADAGHDVVIIDCQHPPGVHAFGRVTRIGTQLHAGIPPMDQYAGPAPEIIFSFPACTDLAVSGARWFRQKLEANPMAQYAAVEMAKFAWTLGDHYSCPWMVENPVGRLSTLWRKPDAWIHPWQYADIEAEDNYTKKTGIWCGNGFVVPHGMKTPIIGEAPDDRIHKAAPGPDRANFRSATPAGFAQAVYEANVIGDVFEGVTQ